MIDHQHLDRSLSRFKFQLGRQHRNEDRRHGRFLARSRRVRKPGERIVQRKTELRIEYAGEPALV
jgi:hypothetical protein